VYGRGHRETRGRRGETPGRDGGDGGEKSGRVHGVDVSIHESYTYIYTLTNQNGIHTSS
jgi:hypothetical protein